MAKYLVIFTDSLDEIEINGFTVMTEKELDSFEETAMSITWPFVKTLKRLFNDNFGVFIDEGFLEEIIGDEDDLDDEDEDDEDGDDDNYGYDDSY
mgnify:CR=1 FL=1